MKIAFLSSLNPSDQGNWSGTLYSIFQTLKKVHEVCWIGGEVLYKLQILYEMQQGSGKKLWKEKHSKKIGNALSKEIRKDAYDLVVARDFSFIAYLEVEIPVVYLADTTFRQINDFFKYPEHFSLYAEDIEQRAIERSDLVVYSSEWARKGAIDYYHAEPDKIKVIEFGANLPRCMLEDIRRPDTPCCNLLFVGRLWKSKGGRKAYETYRLLRESHFNCTLTIIGCEPGPDVSADPSVEVYPYLDKSKKEDVARLKACYEKAGFFILPTEFDCFGIVFSEASAFGVPSIAADVGGVSQVIKTGVNGYLLPADATPDAYASVIRTLYSDKPVYKALCVSARREYRQRLNWDVWLGKVNEAFIETVSDYKNKRAMTDNDVYIPTYIINLKKREDRKNHVLNEFKGRAEFQLNLVEACEHPVGAVGLWNSIRKVVAEAVKMDHDVILICEDDHYFTPDYSREFLFENIFGACRQGAEILNGGIGGFGAAVPVAENRYWVDWFWCTQFIVIYSELYQRILNYEFKDTDTADGVLSQLTDKIMALYPFVSRQRTFGYSDITQGNKENPDLILTHFCTANKRLGLIHSVSKYYNFPWEE